MDSGDVMWPPLASVARRSEPGTERRSPGHVTPPAASPGGIAALAMATRVGFLPRAAVPPASGCGQLGGLAGTASERGNACSAAAAPPPAHVRRSRSLEPLNPLEEHEQPDPDRDHRAERERRAGELQLLAQAGTRLAGSLDEATTLRTAVALGVPGVADWCAIDLRDGQGTLRRRALLPSATAAPRALDDPSSPHVAAVLHGHRAHLYAGPRQGSATAPPDEDGRWLQPAGLTSALVMPLIARTEPLGVLSLGRAAPRPPYSPDDLALAEALAERVALALENARLYRATLAAVAVRDQVVSIASHELRTPLTSLIGFAYLVPHAATQGADAIAALSAQITQQARRLNMLVGQLLDVTRLQRGPFALERQPLDFTALVAQVVDAFRVTLATENAHAIMVERPDTPLILNADGPRLEQVLVNLLTNAVKYSPPGSPITVRLAVQDGQAVLTVADQGIGIPADAQARLFEPFYRAQNVPAQSSGFGIGLYLVHQTVERHGGHVEVDSTEDQGTTIRIMLPLAEEAT